MIFFVLAKTSINNTSKTHRFNRDHSSQICYELFLFFLFLAQASQAESFFSFFLSLSRAHKLARQEKIDLFLMLK